MIAILALVALISAFLIATALNRTAADVSNEREDRSMSALRKAKAALIAYAANEQSQLYYTPGTYCQPGALPCPDRNDDGDADCILPNTASLIGRVPYKTIGLEDLRDASGERLWYALSHDFRKLRCTSIPALPTPPSPPGCTIINSDTKGQLTVVGIAPATQVVAVLFAPGEALQGQNRDPDTTTVAHNDPVNYLEGPPNLDNPARVNFVHNRIALRHVQRQGARHHSGRAHGCRRTGRGGEYRARRQAAPYRVLHRVGSLSVRGAVRTTVHAAG
jgi:hypothetical protein